MAVKPNVNMLCSHISHMAFLFVWRDSGVTQKNGFDLSVHITGRNVPGQEYRGFEDRAPMLLNGTYDFLSGLHHEPYYYRARGDKRFIYIAQAQNDWDDSVVATQEIKSPKDLEGKTVIATSNAPCVYGNLRHSLELGGADLSKINFVTMTGRTGIEGRAEPLDMVVRGEAAAAAVDPPFDLRGEKQGLHRLEIPSVPVIHNATMCANQEWVRQNEETTMAFLRSMVDAIHYFKTQPDACCDIIERNLAPLLRLRDADEIKHLYERWAGLLSPKPFPHPLAVWNVYNLDVSHDPEVNWIGPFEIWNTSYLRAIDDSQYIDELWGSAQAATNPAVNAAI
jgi:hypothetical protein